MTLKELRISKGLTQIECAKYLDMSIRNYQNYENDPDKISTAKYNKIYNKLKGYELVLKESPIIYNYNLYNTNVILANNIKPLLEKVASFKKRDCYSKLNRFIKEEFFGKVCILYGLRRTGKTTLLFQMMADLPLNEVAYIKIKTTDNMSMVTKDLQKLYDNGYKYIFIDEITLMEDFINTAAILSDIFSMMGMKIVVSGTDSLGFVMANNDELYDRNIMIHTSYISFKEYSRLLGINSIDKYIEFGGTLKMENMYFDDPDYYLDEASFRDDESTRRYIDTSIARNIQNTLKNNQYGQYFNELRDLYDNNELTNAINRIVEGINHQFLLKVVTDKFKSHDLGSTKEILLHEFPKNTSTVLYDIDEREVIEKLKHLIDVKEKEELKVNITQNHVEKIKKYLEKLDLLYEVNERYESGGMTKINIITQPGMRYAITKALVYSLLQDKYFSNISESDKTYIINKLLEDVKGRMLEDIVLLEKSKSLNNNFDVFKYKFDSGEFDMVIYNRLTNTCEIYEIKHATQVNPNQTKHLNDNRKCAHIERLFGEITNKYVLYRGDNKTVDDVKYVNVEEYLCK